MDPKTKVHQKTSVGLALELFVIYDRGQDVGTERLLEPGSS